MRAVSGWKFSAGLACGIAAACLAACSQSGNQGPVIAKVGSYEIAGEELELLTAGKGLAFSTLEDEYTYKRAYLDTMIETRLLIEGAYQKQIDKHEEVARAVALNKNQFLIDILYEQEVTSKVSVTPAEVKAHWNNLEFVIMLHHILLPTEDSAQAIFARLKAGENYEQLAYTASADPGAKTNRGQVGRVVYTSLLQEMAQVAFALDTGQIAPPFKTVYGWHIVKVSEKSPNAKRKPFETSEKEYEQEALAMKRNALTQTFIAEMKERYKVAIDTNTSLYVLKKRDNLYPPQILASLPRSDFDIKQLDRNERDLTLATWEGGQLSLGEYLEETAGVDPRAKPSFDQFDSLSAAIWMLRASDLFALEATKRGIENDPKYKRKLKLLREMTMAEIMKNDSLTVGLVVTDSMSRSYYDAHLAEFTLPARVRVFEILTSDQALATRLARTVRSLEDFKEHAVQHTERISKRATSGDLGYIDGKGHPELFAAANALPSGSFGGPVVTQGKFAIFYVADKLPEQLKDYLDVKRDIVSKQVEELRRQALDQWLTSQKATVAISVNEEALKKALEQKRGSEGAAS